MAVKQGYPHFMIKEIHEQPATLRNTLRMQEHYLDLISTFLDRATEVFLVACGTSYHACWAASYMFSKLAFLPTFPVYASEFNEQHGKSVNIDSTILAVSMVKVSGSSSTRITVGRVSIEGLRSGGVGLATGGKNEAAQYIVAARTTHAQTWRRTVRGRVGGYDGLRGRHRRRPIGRNAWR